MYEGRVHKQISHNRLSSPMYEGRVHSKSAKLCMREEYINRPAKIG